MLGGILDRSSLLDLNSHATFDPPRSYLSCDLVSCQWSLDGCDLVSVSKSGRFTWWPLVM